ncbi:wax ester/triacylglycerol synthase domain-containing protein [Nonomuraea wenchangensis]
MTVTARSPAATVIDRAGPADVAMLAMGTGDSLPQRAGAVLVLEPGPGFEVAQAAALLGEWLRSVPRLRRRLVRVPLGCGRPVWVDDPLFDLRLHVRELTCPAPGDERSLLDVAATVLTGPLPPCRWTAVFVTGLNDGAVALIVVLDHVLAVLAAAADRATADLRRRASGSGGRAVGGPPPRLHRQRRPPDGDHGSPAQTPGTAG